MTKTVNLILRFKLLNQPQPMVRLAVRIQIGGDGQLRIWGAPSAVPETVDFADIESISIQNVSTGSKPGLSAR